jgi:hypothetical protein
MQKFKKALISECKAHALCYFFQVYMQFYSAHAQFNVIYNFTILSLSNFTQPQSKCLFLFPLRQVRTFVYVTDIFFLLFPPFVGFQSIAYQGCQMVYFQTKNANLGKFWWAWQWKMLVYLMTILLFYGHLVDFPPFW